MAEVFVDECHPSSKRCVILEDNGKSAWLYLTPRGGNGIDKDAFVYSPIQPQEELDREAMQLGEPPALRKEFVSNRAVINNPAESDFSFKWSTDGESVAVLYQGAPLAMILSSHKRGFSVALSNPSGFGQPWNKDLYEQLFK